MGTPKNNSVIKAFDILNAVAANLGAMTPAEVAEAVGQNLSTVHRFLLTLEEVGAISRLPGNRYRLGMMVAELAGAYRHDVIAERARGVSNIFPRRLVKLSVLRRLTDTGSNSSSGPNLSGPSSSVSGGDRPMPVHASALGKVFIAGLP